MFNPVQMEAVRNTNYEFQTSSTTRYYTMNISEAAQQSGLSSKTIRYYESVGLISSPERGENGYRDYRAKDISLLKFLSHSREVGFSLQECKQLLALYLNPERQSVHVKSLVLEKLDEIEIKLANLRGMKKTLKSLAERCAGDEGPDCAIIETLAGEQ